MADLIVLYILPKRTHATTLIAAIDPKDNSRFGKYEYRSLQYIIWIIKIYSESSPIERKKCFWCFVAFRVYRIL